MNNSKNINRIKKLRKLISDNQLDAFLIPHEDEFLSEYLPKYTERLKWITGFTGSAGLSIISTNKAAIFVDGRYTTQVKLETFNKAFDYFHLINPGLFKWIEKNPYKLKRLGFDPRTISQSNYKALNYSCAKKGIKLIESKNLIDELWNRKKERNNKVAIHELKYSGLSSSKKRNKIVSYLKKHKVNSLFISQPENLCWLLNIRGNDLEHTPIVRSSAVITKDNSITIFTDNKNIKGKIHQWIGKEIEILNFNNIKNFISKTNFKSIQFDPNYTPSNIAKIFNNFILETFERDDPITLLKACKNSTEINGSRKAHLIDGIALTKFLCWLDTSSSETRIDELTTCEELLKYRKRSKSFKSLSFNTISGTGSNGAIIHYKSNKKSNKFLKENDLFLLDSGGQYKYGTTDVTRTISIAKDQKKIDYEKIINFTLVLKGHIALALEHFKYGETGLKLDYLARKFLKKNGLNFDHGTGHGVGSYLGVHEGPQNISPRSRIILEKGMIVSNEPGYYKENEYGIRIENLVTVVKSKNKNKDLTMETLTLAPIDKKLIDKSLLTKKEISWLNNYHNKVYRKLNPYLNKKEKLWLKNSTKAI
jgi:Xaa-Pro aminopeptidase